MRLLPLAILLSSMAEGGSAIAADERALPAPAAEQGEAIGIGKKILEFGKSVDRTHDRIERDILQQTIRFDDFFGSATPRTQRQTAYELRWRNSIRIEQDGEVRPGTSVRANVVLSKISDRLRLAISGEKEAEPFSPSLPQDPGSPGFDRTLPTASIVNTELRYGLIRSPTVDFFVGAGVRIALPFEIFVRSRYQYTHRIDDVSLLRVAETPFIKNTDWLGETTEISVERILSRKTLLLWANTGTASEEIEGLEWGSELSLIHQLSPKSSVTLTEGIYGNTSESAAVNNYRALARYRRNFLRTWLYYELEPEVSWPSGGHYNPRFAFTFRIEVVFQGAAPGREDTFIPSVQQVSAVNRYRPEAER
jgi:hypothetical protein